jgi:hypothetical protein
MYTLFISQHSFYRIYSVIVFNIIQSETDTHKHIMQFINN